MRKKITTTPNIQEKTVKKKNIPAKFELKRNFQADRSPFTVIAKNALNEIIEDMSFDLSEVSVEELAAYRKTEIPSFVLKVEGKLYYSLIPDINFYSYDLLGNHQCAVVGHECNRLSAATDENGGCEKVRNFSKEIEKYPWITIGYETFNTAHNSFVVVKCLHYEQCPPTVKHSFQDIMNTKLGLAQYIWDDVKSSPEVRERLIKNGVIPKPKEEHNYNTY